MTVPADTVAIGGGIDRVDANDAARLFRDHLARQRPAVFAGAIDRCAALSSWTDEYLKAKIGQKTCRIYVSKDGQFPGGEGRRDPELHQSTEITVADLLERIADGVEPGRPIFWPGEHYYMYRGMNEVFDAVASDVVPPSFLDAVDARLNGFWVSQAGNLTPPHIDFLETGLAQIRGRKRVLLWTPSQIPRLYLVPLGQDGARQSQLDITRPDLVAFPKFRDASALQCTLEPGDLLFIPFGYAHCVRSETPSISATWTWGANLTHQIRRVLPSRLQAYCVSHPIALIRAALAFHRPRPADPGAAAGPAPRSGPG